ncbi:MAG: hypothetical protein WBW84_21830 [Acidobacteriaceae bacterium]
MTLKAMFLSAAKTKAIGAGSAMAGVLYVDARLAARSPEDGDGNSRHGNGGGAHGVQAVHG